MTNPLTGLFSQQLIRLTFILSILLSGPRAQAFNLPTEPSAGDSSSAKTSAKTTQVAPRALAVPTFVEGDEIRIDKDGLHVKREPCEKSPACMRMVLAALVLVTSNPKSVTEDELPEGEATGMGGKIETTDEADPAEPINRPKPAALPTVQEKVYNGDKGHSYGIRRIPRLVGAPDKTSGQSNGNGWSSKKQ